jgi:N-carbamoyl-L-amino-acid hydrolase
LTLADAVNDFYSSTGQNQHAIGQPIDERWRVQEAAIQNTHRELERRMALFSTFGATAAGGIHRPEATPANGEARRALVDWLEGAGFAVRVDPIGNIFGLLELGVPEAPWLMTGSHIDSQPNGGRFDGTYGVVAAAIAAIDLRDRLAAAGQQPAMNLVVAAWTNEEGARFQPSVLGSSAYVGNIELDWALARTDRDGVSVAEALDAIGFRGSDAPAPRPAAYVELHIECGPLLERAGRRLGTFDRWWGCHKLEIRFVGRPAHTGPTPMAERRDALLAAAAVITGVRRLVDAHPEGDLHTSVGRIEVEPNSPNVVPSAATIFLELRSADPAVLERSFVQTRQLIEDAAAATGVTWSFVRDELRRPGRFAVGLQALANEVAAGLGHPAMRLDTIAAHDAVPLARLCPSIVVAVPSVGGICHAPEEFTEPADLMLGLDLLSSMLERLATEGPELIATLERKT